MGSYRLSWKESVHKDLRRLSSVVIIKIIKKIETLPTLPAPVDSKKLKDTEHTYRLRAGDYRIIYQVNTSDKEITICRVRHRKDVYKV